MKSDVQASQQLDDALSTQQLSARAAEEALAAMTSLQSTIREGEKQCSWMKAHREGFPLSREGYELSAPIYIEYI